MTMLSDKIFSTYLGIEFSGDSAVLTYIKNTVSGLVLLESEQFSVTSGDTVPDDVLEFVNRYRISTQKVFVTMPDRWAITKFLDIPSMKGKGKGALENLIKFELARHIPFEVDEVAHDFMVVNEDGNNTSIVFVAIQNEKMQLLRNYLQKLSIEPDSVTTLPFAVLNAIELGESSPGGWQDIIGIIRRSDILGNEGDLNAVICIHEMTALAAVIKDGLCISMRSFNTGAEPGELPVISIARHLAQMQATLLAEHYNKVIITGDEGRVQAFHEQISGQIEEGIISVQDNMIFSPRLKDTSINGLAPSIGACFGGLGIGTYRINLLPHKTDYHIRRLAPLAAKVFIAIIVALLVGLFTTNAVSQKKFLARMEKTIAENKPHVEALENMLTDINALREKDKVLQALRNREITLEVLSELSRIIPADAWVTNLQYTGPDIQDRNKDGEIVLSGFAASSSVLIPLLEDSPYFEKVEFVGSIKKTRNMEQFKLSARVVSSPEEKGTDK